MLITFNQFIKLKNFKIQKDKINNYKVRFVRKLCQDDFDTYYLNKIFKDNRNILLIFIISGDISSYQKFDEIGFVVIRKISDYNNNIKFAIPLLGIHHKMRNFGYGELLLKNLETYINKNFFKKYFFILHTLKKSLNFYLRYGFKPIAKNKYLQRIEELKEDDILLEYSIN